MESTSVEELILLAIKYHISLLQVGDVKIVPGPTPKTTAEELGVLKDAEKRLGRPLTEDDKIDEILFGPGGSIRLNDE